MATKTTFLFRGTAKQRRHKWRAWFRLLSLRTTNYDLLGAKAALEEKNLRDERSYARHDGPAAALREMGR